MPHFSGVFNKLLHCVDSLPRGAKDFRYRNMYLFPGIFVKQENVYKVELTN
jgi:hypothetical protein